MASMCQFIFITISIYLWLISCFISSVEPLCHDDEIVALLQLKHSLRTDKSAPESPSSYPKLASWTADGNSGTDCCSWDGVECDEITGHVVGLDLSSSRIYGSIAPNSSLFTLSQLRSLNLADNNFNHSQISSGIGHLTRLTYLNLSRSLFFGQIPSEISLLSNLSSLDLSYVNISSPLPQFVANLSSLTSLHLRNCGLYGILSNTSIFQGENQLTKLTFLDLSSNEFTGQIPNSLQNFTQITTLRLGDNLLAGQIPPFLGNLTRLTLLGLAENKFDGSIPVSFSRLKNLQILNLYSNNLSGIVDFDTMFLGLKHLSRLQLSYNRLWVIFDEHNVSNSMTPHFDILGLDSCNLSAFPAFLRYQDRLMTLILSENRIYGQVPEWIWNISINTLAIFDVSENLLTGFDHPSAVLPWIHLLWLDLSNNLLEGPLPLPSTSMITYAAFNNNLRGEISPFLCNATSLQFLELSYNYFTGNLPKCFEKLSTSLLVLGLRSNYFSGTIPQICGNGSKLEGMDLGKNKFRGQLPQSLTNCLELKSLNLEDNQLEDVFPSWLGTLPRLRLLTLRYNRFYGTIRWLPNSQVSSLHLLDLSHNHFTGKLQCEYFRALKAIKEANSSSSSYMSSNPKFDARFPWRQTYMFSATVTNKGMDLQYERIQQALVVINLSGNKLEGEIPGCIGILHGLRVLNLSNNILAGGIPSSLGTIRQLESLDLSRNKLSGEIPQELAQLTFLSFLNVSYNNLTGHVPRGSQLNTFESNSYLGNSGLCGDPLPRRCEDATSLAPLPSTFEDSGTLLFGLFDWVTVVPGLVCGLLVGAAIEHALAMNKYQLLRKWPFLPTFEWT